MDKKDYLKYKKMERQDQIRLQKEIYKNEKKPVTIQDSVTVCTAINKISKKEIGVIKNK